MKTPHVSAIAVFASFCLPLAAAAQAGGRAAAAAAAVRPDIVRINQVKTIEELRTVSTATVNRLSSELDVATADKARLQRERDDLARQRTALAAERDALLAEKKKLEQEKVKLTAQNEELRLKGEAISTANTTLEAKNRELSSAQRELEKTKDELVATRAKLDREIAEQQTRHGTLRAENERLEQATAQLQKDLDWKSLLVKIFSGSTVTGLLAVMGFMVSRRTSVLQNEKLELENQRLRREVEAKP